MIYVCDLKVSIEGSIPVSLFQMDTLESLTLFNNYFSGVLPSISHEFVYFFSHSNRLSCSLEKTNYVNQHSKNTSNTLILTGNGFQYPGSNASFIAKEELSHTLTIPSSIKTDLALIFTLIASLFTVPLIYFL